MCGRYATPEQEAIAKQWHTGCANNNPFPALGWFEMATHAAGQGKVVAAPSGSRYCQFRWHRGYEAIESCTIIVGEANTAMSHVHNRMPVIIEPKDEAFWLDTSIDAVPALEALLKPPPDDMIIAHTVRSDKRPQNDDATLIDPIDSADC